MGIVKFIHASDIHLGHQQFNLEQRFHDFSAAFARVVENALAEKVDFVLIGGDFFHKRAIDAETLRVSMELLTPLKEAGIPVIAIEGNHDKAFYQEKSSWMNLLNSLGYIRLLKPQYEAGRVVLSNWASDKTGCITEVAGIRVIGLGYLGATTAQRLQEVAQQLDEGDADTFTILLLHAAVDKLLGQDLGGVRKEVLDGFRGKVDYIALGHIHSRQEIDDWLFNPGGLENCHLDEAKEGKEKGHYLVTLEGKTKGVQHISSSFRKVCFMHIDIGGAANHVEVRERVLSHIERAGLEKLDRPICHIVLKGEIEFSAIAIDISTLVREIRELTGCLFVEVQNCANLPAGDIETGGTGIKSRAEIERQVLRQLTERQFPDFKVASEKIVELAVKLKDAALSGEPQEDVLGEIRLLADELPDLSDSQGLVAAAVQENKGGQPSEDQED